jgi:hypothetical protein
VSDDKLELMRGSGNVFRDFGYPNPDLEQARAIVAAKIISALDERRLSTREAERLTGVGRVNSRDTMLLWECMPFRYCLWEESGHARYLRPD